MQSSQRQHLLGCATYDWMSANLHIEQRGVEKFSLQYSPFIIKATTTCCHHWDFSNQFHVPYTPTALEILAFILTRFKEPMMAVHQNSLNDKNLHPSQQQKQLLLLQAAVSEKQLQLSLKVSLVCIL